MSIKGFPSSQKLPLGTGITSNFTTVIPTDPYRNALETLRFAFRVGSASIPRTAGVNTGVEYLSGDDAVLWIYDSSTVAQVGDFVRFEDGSAKHLELPIVKVEANRFMVASIPTGLPSSGNTFYILRYVTQRTDDTGSQEVVLTPQVNNDGSYSEITNLTTAAQTLTKPSGAVGFVLESESSNTQNVRYKIGAAATTTSGMRLEPGRDTGYIPCAANISVCAEAGSSQKVTIQWILSV